MRGPGEGEMEAGKSVYQVTAQFSLKMCSKTTFPLMIHQVEEILHKRIFSWDAHLESKYMSQKRICFCEQSVYAESPLHVVFRDIGVVLVVIAMVLDEWTWRVGDQQEVD